MLIFVQNRTKEEYKKYNGLNKEDCDYVQEKMKIIKSLLGEGDEEDESEEEEDSQNTVSDHVMSI